MQSNKKKIDAAWNDPPKFSYTEFLEHSKSPKRNVLNKRVPFPLNSDSKSSSPTVYPIVAPPFNVNLPPPPSCVASVSAACELKSKTTSTPNEISELGLDDKSAIDAPAEEYISKINEEEDSRMLIEILNNLEAVMHIKREWLKSKNKYELIKKKLQVMDESWKKNKLTPEVKKELYKLANELRNGNKERADKIHISLMVDYPNLCCEFISVFRQLINIE